MKFQKWKDCSLSNLHFINSSQAHISILDSKNISLSNLRIEASGDSPNTDGIHIHRSNQITINQAWIGSGTFVPPLTLHAIKIYHSPQPCGIISHRYCWSTFIVLNRWRLCLHPGLLVQHQNYKCSLLPWSWCKVIRYLISKSKCYLYSVVSTRELVIPDRLKFYVRSIGNLGKSGNYVQVQNILVNDVTFIEPSIGARIKTWQVTKVNDIHNTTSTVA